MKPLRIWMLLTVFLAAAAQAEDLPDPQKLVLDSFQYMRGRASESVVTMTIHRPGWERISTIKAWTLDTQYGLFRITAPARDKGNGTLKKGIEMWTYNPRINRAIKLPPSMMSQAWQGSDFSNNDLAKSDTLINDFTHTIDGFRVQDGKKVYQVTSLPRPDAPVIWGLLKLEIREDLILLKEAFYDEDRQLVKVLTTDNIQFAGDRLFPVSWKMRKADQIDEYTQLSYESIQFLDQLPLRLFSLSSLKNPGR